MTPTSHFIPGIGWVPAEELRRKDLPSAPSVIVDGASYFSEALDCEVRGRSHRNKLMKARGLRHPEKGEAVAPKREAFKLGERTKKLQAHVKRHGVNWNFVEKHCPGYLPNNRGADPRKGVNVGRH